MKTVAITTQEALKHALSVSKTNLVLFTANWCRQNPVYEPILEQYEEDHNKNIVRIDVVLSPELVYQYNISKVPCLVKLEDDLKMVTKREGVLSREELDNL